MERPTCIVCGKPAETGGVYKGKQYWRKLCNTCRQPCRIRIQKFNLKVAGGLHIHLADLGLTDNDLHQCNCCKQEFPFRCELHHKNKTRTDSTRENLTILCPNCHTLLHYKERKHKTNSIGENKWLTKHLRN